MGAITSIVYVGKKEVFSEGTPGGLICELWRIPASTAGDTQTIACKHITTPIAVVGAEHTAITTSSIALKTLQTVDADNFRDLLVFGYATP